MPRSVHTAIPVAARTSVWHTSFFIVGNFSVGNSGYRTKIITAQTEDTAASSFNPVVLKRKISGWADINAKETICAVLHIYANIITQLVKRSAERASLQTSRSCRQRIESPKKRLGADD